VSGRADASGRIALHATVCVDHDLLGCSLAEQVVLLGAMDPRLDSPELVAVPRPACRCSPVEVLMIRSERRFLWCPQCEAIWAVDLSPALADSKPDVIAHASVATRRLL
jgi:hypothetical protein